jgi:hypothetical protein
MGRRGREEGGRKWEGGGGRKEEGGHEKMGGSDREDVKQGEGGGEVMHHTIIIYDVDWGGVLSDDYILL